jgi:hypothetical protein
MELGIGIFQQDLIFNNFFDFHSYVIKKKFFAVFHSEKRFEKILI